MTVRRSLWRWRLALIGAGWLAIVTALALLEMRPAVVALAAIVGAVAAVLWVVLDVSDLAAPLDWRAHADMGGTTRGADARVRVLRRQIFDGHTFDGSSAIQRTLLSLVDDSLRARHGIDREREPRMAAEVLGPDLVSLVSNPDTAAWSDPVRLARVLDHVERFVMSGRPASRPTSISSLVPPSLPDPPERS